MDKVTIIRYLIGIILLAILIYLIHPAVALSLILTASPYYLAMAAAFYPITMLIYTYRWKFILSNMDSILPINVAYQAITGSALISDFTPGRLGILLKPLMVRDRVHLNRGFASVIIDIFVDSLTATLLGITGLLILPHRWNIYLEIGVIGLFCWLFLISLLWVRRDFALRLVERMGNKQLIETARSLYDAIESIENTSRLVIVATIVSLAIWVSYMFRIFFITRSLGFTAPIYMIFFLLPLVSLLSVLPITVAGLGLTETGMALLMVMLGLPASIGVPVALLDRSIGIVGDLLFGGRYAIKLLRSGLFHVARSK